MRWKYLWYIHREFSYESFGERILKIGPYLPKLLSNIKNVVIYALDLVSYALRLVKRALHLVKRALDLVIYALDLIKHALNLINYVLDPSQLWRSLFAIYVLDQDLYGSPNDILLNFGGQSPQKTEILRALIVLSSLNKKNSNPYNLKTI